MKKKLDCYLFTHRRRWGFTQKELSHLLGCRSASVVSRLERAERKPSLTAAFGCEIIFGVSAGELFPALFDSAEEEVLTRAYDLYERLQGNRSRATRTKLDILEAAFTRARARGNRKDI